MQSHLSNPLEMTACCRGGQGSGKAGPLEGQQEGALPGRDPASRFQGAHWTHGGHGGGTECSGRMPRVRGDGTARGGRTQPLDCLRSAHPGSRRPVRLGPAPMSGEGLVSVLTFLTLRFVLQRGRLCDGSQPLMTPAPGRGGPTGQLRSAGRAPQATSGAPAAARGMAAGTWSPPTGTSQAPSTEPILSLPPPPRRAAWQSAWSR